jgi:hypothetical protein
MISWRCAERSRKRKKRFGGSAWLMNRLGLHPAKTKLVDLRRRKESFVLLGCTIRKEAEHTADAGQILHAALV